MMFSDEIWAVGDIEASAVGGGDAEEECDSEEVDEEEEAVGECCGIVFVDPGDESSAGDRLPVD